MWLQSASNRQSVSLFERFLLKGTILHRSPSKLLKGGIGTHSKVKCEQRLKYLLHLNERLCVAEHSFISAGVIDCSFGANASITSHACDALEDWCFNNVSHACCFAHISTCRFYITDIIIWNVCSNGCVAQTKTSVCVSWDYATYGCICHLLWKAHTYL